MTKDSKRGLREGAYRARVGVRTFDVVLQGGHLVVDGAPVDGRFEVIREGFFVLLVEGRSLPVVVERVAEGRLRVTVEGRQVEVHVQDEEDLLLERFGFSGEAGAAAREVRAPMPGLVLTVLVEPGAQVKPGDGLVVLEAMKMENELGAPAEGTVQVVHVKPGDAVGKNELLIEFEG